MAKQKTQPVNKPYPRVDVSKDGQDQVSIQFSNNGYQSTVVNITLDDASTLIKKLTDFLINSDFPTLAEREHNKDLLREALRTSGLLPQHPPSKIREFMHNVSQSNEATQIAIQDIRTVFLEFVLRKVRPPKTKLKP